jgi:YVTN family beta-propeller protein
MANESNEKLQQVCQKTMVAIGAAAVVVQSEATQWTARVRAWSKQEVRGAAEIASQTYSQIGEGLAQVEQTIARVKNRSQSLPTDIVSLTGTSSIEVKDLIEAIVEMKQILKQIDYRQVKLEAKQAAEIAKEAKNVAGKADREEVAVRIQFRSGSAVAEAEKKTEKAKEEAKEKAKEAEQASVLVEKAKAALGKEPVGAAKKTKNAILATDDTLQRIVFQLKQVYFEQMEATAAEAELTRTEAKKWVAAKAKDPLQIENWLKQMNLICKAIEEMLRQKVVQAIAQDTGNVDIDYRLYEVEKSLARIQNVYPAEIAIMQEAWIAARNEATREMEVAMAAKAGIEAKKKIAAENRAKMGEMLYVVNKGSDVVSIIATATNEVIETIPVGKSPQRVAVTPDRTRILITNAGDDTVSILETVTHQTIAVVSVGNHPLGIAINPNSTQAYVANYGSGTVSVLDLQTSRKPGTIRVGDNPVSVAFVWGGARVFVTNSLSCTISVIDKATQRVIQEIQLLDGSPQGVAAAPDGSKAYVTNEQSNAIIVVNVFDNKKIVEIQVGQGPTEIAITSDRTKVYVVNSRDNSVSVVNITTNPPTLVTTIAVGDCPVGIAFSGDGMRAYVSNEKSQNISVIHTDTFEMQGWIVAGQSPVGMATWIAQEEEKVRMEAEEGKVAEAKVAEESADFETEAREPFGVVMRRDENVLVLSKTVTAAGGGGGRGSGK